jgi:ribosomal protein S18 acetylase RimI-like enzyme
MVTFTTRPYLGETDLQPIADLLNFCEAIDQEDTYYTVTGLQMEFTAPNCDPSRDLRLWHDSNDQLIAFGQLQIPSEFMAEVNGFLWFRVHPDARNCGLESEIMDWAEHRIRAIAQTQNLPARLLTGCRDHQSERIRLFEQHGFTYERCFFRMVRSMAEPIPLLPLPQGFTLRCGKELDAAAWVEMHNQSFIDHWNFHPLTIEQFIHWASDSLYRTDLDLVAIAPDGTYAAFCFAYIDTEQNQQKGRSEGHISLLGTRRGFRRLGLGRAMLLAGLRRLKAAGMDTATIGVDAQNPHQAYTLYESVGFCKQRVSLNFARPL